MNKKWYVGLGLVSAALIAGCAVRPNPDPRDPARIKDTPVVLRVCAVDGNGPHLRLGDQIELTTNGIGRLSIRHIPRDGRERIWNGGRPVAVRDAVLVEMVQAQGDQKNTRRFVPVGRFKVKLADDTRHERFDFLASKAVDHLNDDAFKDFPECRVPLGADEVIIRGVDDKERHGGNAHLR